MKIRKASQLRFPDSFAVSVVAFRSALYKCAEILKLGPCRQFPESILHTMKRRVHHSWYTTVYEACSLRRN